MAIYKKIYKSLVFCGYDCAECHAECGRADEMRNAIDYKFVKSFLVKV